MRKFVKALITNRFGIVLATLNVCYFVSRNYIHFIFDHTHGENCVFLSRHHFFYIFYGLEISSSELLIILNLPAEILSLLLGNFTQRIFPDLCSYTQGKFQLVFFIIFVTLQWLFIGWTAKTIARRIRPANV